MTRPSSILVSCGLVLTLLLTRGLAQNVQADCLETAANIAMLTYTGDARGVVGYNVNGSECWFNEDIPTATFVLNVEYTDSNQGACVMTKKGTDDIYSMRVQARLLTKEYENDGDLNFEVICNFEPASDPVESGVEIKQEASIPSVVQQDKGTPAQSGFSLNVRKIDGTAFTRPVTLGRIVKLVADMTPQGNEVGLKPSTCTVEATDGSNMNVILSNGCGTGSPFPLGYGFITKNFVSTSPTFRMFAAVKGQGVKFNCSFIACLASCEGSSCDKAGINVRKRSVDDPVEDGVIIGVDSPIVQHEKVPGIVEKIGQSVKPVQKPREIKVRTQTVHLSGSGPPMSSADVETEVVVGADGDLLLSDLMENDIGVSEIKNRKQVRNIAAIQETDLRNEITALAVVVVVLSVVILVIVCAAVFVIVKRKEVQCKPNE